jgi:hypothetical protein
MNREGRKRKGYRWKENIVKGKAKQKTREDKRRNDEYTEN